MQDASLAAPMTVDKLMVSLNCDQMALASYILSDE